MLTRKLVSAVLAAAALLAVAATQALPASAHFATQGACDRMRYSVSRWHDVPVIAFTECYRSNGMWHFNWL
jgi:hypothetical protein